MKKIISILLVVFGLLNVQANQYIRVEKSGRGEPMIIVAGLGGTEVWKRSIQAWSGDHTCYLISLRGLCGDKNRNEPDFAAAQEEIAGFVRDEKITGAVLIGHSFGGFLVMQLAINHPGYFKKLILVDSYPFSISVLYPAFTEEAGKQQSALVRKQLNELPEADYYRFWLQNVQQFTSDTVFQKIILEKITGSERKFIAEAQAWALSNDERTELGKTTCPVVALCSSFLFRSAGLTGDMIRERISDQFANSPDCNIFINDQARHFIMLDDEIWFLEKIDENI